MCVVKVIKRERQRERARGLEATGLKETHEKLASQQCHNAEGLLAKLVRNQF